MLLSRWTICVLDLFFRIENINFVHGSAAEDTQHMNYYGSVFFLSLSFYVEHISKIFRCTEIKIASQLFHFNLMVEIEWVEFDLAEAGTAAVTF